jgi:hypothetical protein
MGIPVFTIDGILPPFTGAGPGDDPSLMSPYAVDSMEVAIRFGTTDGRRRILNGWLDHRAALREIGIVDGFQWLDGSFLEEKEPNDLDIVCFIRLPQSVSSVEEQLGLWNNNLALFDRSAVRATYSLDCFFIDLNGSPEALVSLSRYYLQLFSHQRQTFLWKGMIQIPLEVATDALAREQLLIPLPTIELGEGQI